jgi:hypothetical protein
VRVYRENPFRAHPLPLGLRQDRFLRDRIVVARERQLQRSQPKSTPNRTSAKFPTTLRCRSCSLVYIYIYIYVYIASHLSYSPSVGVQSYNISMYKRGEDDRATLENRRKKKYIYICRICTQNHSLGRPILTRRIYNISSSSSSSAVYSSTNLLRVLTRTHTHICVVTIVVPPSRRGILRSLYKTIAAVEGAQILRIVYICTLRRGGGVVEFIPDVPNFPPSSIYY